MNEKTNEAIIKAIGIAGYLLLTLASITFGILACVAFVTIFTGDGIFGLMGLIANAVVASAIWSIRKNALV